jgi:hypothetical protein
MKRALASLLVCTILPIVLLTGGCGGHTPALRTYTDRVGRFSVTYDNSKLKLGMVAPVTKRLTFAFVAHGPTYRGTGFSVSFIDRDSKDIRGDTPGQLSVNVLQASRTIEPPSLIVLRRAAKLFFIGKFYVVGSSATRTVVPVTVNGLSGYAISTSWSTGRTTVYVLFRGKWMYFLNTMATTSSWPGVAGTFETAVQSFRAL